MAALEDWLVIRRRFIDGKIQQKAIVSHYGISRAG